MFVTRRERERERVLNICGVAACKMLEPNMHFLQKKETHVSTITDGIGSELPVNRGALPPTFLCFVSDCGVNMDSVAGKTGKCLQMCAQDLVLKAGWCMREWEKVRNRTGVRSAAETEQPLTAWKWKPVASRPYGGMAASFQSDRGTYNAQHCVCHTHAHQVNNWETTSALSWLQSGIPADPNLDPELPQSPRKHDV